MGLSSSKTTTTSGPSKEAMPYLQAGSNAIQGAYDANQGNLSNIGSTLSNAFDKYSAGIDSNPLKAGTDSYLGDVIGGKYLSESNPQLENVINTTNNSVSDRINALFSRAGQSGSSRQQGELGARLAENESGLRYKNYDDEQNRVMQAIQAAMAGRSVDAQEQGTLAGLGEAAATTPYLGAQFLAQGMGGLWGNSQTSTQKTSGNIFQSLIGAAAQAGGAYAAGASDRRLKTNIEQIGAMSDGLPVYEYDYREAPDASLAALMPSGRHIGVMADEVALYRPWAVLDDVSGYSIINYGAL